MAASSSTSVVVAAVVVLTSLAACCLAAVPTPLQEQQQQQALFQTIGTCTPNDKLLHAESVRKSAKWMQVRHQLVSYPADESERPAGTISCIQLSAQKNTNVGSAVLQSGGPGQQAATIMVKSERGHSVAWNVLIYGSNK